jgi:hypothetical protein
VRTHETDNPNESLNEQNIIPTLSPHEICAQMVITNSKYVLTFDWSPTPTLMSKPKRAAPMSSLGSSMRV